MDEKCEIIINVYTKFDEYKNTKKLSKQMK